jgi:hypothetical protein
MAAVGKCWPGPSWVLVGLRWLALAFVGRRGPSLAVVGLHWPALAVAGRRWSALAVVGLREPALACQLVVTVDYKKNIPGVTVSRRLGLPAITYRVVG